MTSVVLACAAGAWLARRGILHREGVASLSSVVFKLMLPCLLFSKISSGFTAEDICNWWILPVMAIFYNLIGMSMGQGIRRVFKVQDESKEAVVAACTFANSGYLPMTLIAALYGVSAGTGQDPQAAARGIAYISVYLVAQSPFLWGWGYPYLGGKTGGWPPLNRIFSPPVYGIIAGVFIALLPPLNQLFYGSHPPLRVLLSTVDLLGAGTLPCAMLIIGANLSRIQIRDTAVVPPRVIAAVSAVRLLIMPLVGIGVTLTLAACSLIPDDPLFRLVLMLEAATPSAANLVVMCQLHQRGEKVMATLIFWEYLFSILTLTLFLSLHLLLAGRGG